MKTNFQMLKDLENWFPKNRGFLEEAECEHISTTLCIEEMDELQLRNLRDFTVLYFNANEDYTENRVKTIDKVSAITAVIDNRLWQLGCEV